ncbi:phosphoglycolate phosphatase [Stella humosa]|uniref:Phosphoglycolate phosphatase n=1 Tax=Stella humosa TaxID=94 RepID=A0A3N1M1S9_9PROT|nr:phosphoglycolate phosphatase [Stella humosa]ROP99671.1 phosphoglycolate phosphatase [Stella humosa]BBK31104.1 phosphoglycolate phosphatase [Stella humosa]
MTPERFPAIIFDFDGTLVDSAADLRTALNRLLAEQGLEPRPLDAVRRMIGDGALKLVERGFAAAGRPVEGDTLARHGKRFLEIYEPISADSTETYPGVMATLEGLAAAGHKLGLCTNKPERATRLMLASLGLDRLLTSVVGGDSLPVKKPDPAPLLAAIAGLGLTPAQALMVGDNEHDVATAKAAGVPVVAVSYGYARVPLAELHADAIIDDFADLPTAIARVAAR